MGALHSAATSSSSKMDVRRESSGSSGSAIRIGSLGRERIDGLEQALQRGLDAVAPDHQFLIGQGLAAQSPDMVEALLQIGSRMRLQGIDGLGPGHAPRMKYSDKIRVNPGCRDGGG